VFPTVPPPSQRLLVFARLPERGRVKTRLGKSIGDERALAVYEAMIRDVLQSVGPATEDMEIEVMWAPSESANGEELRRAFGERPTAMQTGVTLGDRLAMAFSERLFFHRTETIIAIGVDDPLLSREAIDHAFGLLRSCDWVVGPAADGGYYLIGCRAPAFDAEVFRNITWGSDSVFATTRDRIRQRETTLAILPLRHDIDTEEDLRRFAAANNDGELAALLRAS
jgi:rSAM/selenodomain-associated transferase 1